MLNKISEILTSWVIDEKIDDTECMRLLNANGLDADESEYLMEVVNSKEVSILGVVSMIKNDLDQSMEFDDDIDGFKQYLSEKLELEFDPPCNESPYDDYLKTESGVYA